METKRFEPDSEVNIDEELKDHRHDMLDEVARIIAEDTLPDINANSADVRPKNSPYTRYGKRALDILLSLLALIVTSPVNLVLAVCTYFDVGRPILFKQQRVGKNGELFTVVKFRNMTNDTYENGELLPPSERVTKFGAFVRKTSLDELLNFWSVFKGDMSIIGPRPLALRYEERYSERHRKRNLVKPGLECPILNTKGKRATWEEQFENDIYYVEHVSLALDLRLVWLLVRMVLDRKGSSERGSATRGSFMGYREDGSCINSRHVPARYVNAALERYEGKSQAPV